MKKCPKCGKEVADGNFCPECGTAVVEVEAKSASDAAPEPAPAPQNTKTSAPVPGTVSYGESKFTGGAFENYFRMVAVNFVTGITLGIAYPFMQCWYMRWKVEQTYINGKRMTFDGKGGDLFKKYIIWLLLSAITLGIYFIVKGKINIIKWETEHTHVEGGPDKPSSFDGKWYQLLGVNLAAYLVSLVTLGFGAYWAYCYKNRWFTKHKYINGCQLAFTGKGIQFFGKCIVWVLLTVITFGIYSFWLTVNIMKWGAKHTVFVDGGAEAWGGNGTPNAEVAAVEAAPAKPQNPFAIAGLILSIFMPFVGLIVSIVGLVKCKDYEGSGKGLAIAGIVIGVLFTIGGLVSSLFSVLIPILASGFEDLAIPLLIAAI